jgi:restriction system protein
MTRAKDQSARLDPAFEVRAMKWPNVQLLLAEAFRQRGFLVREIGGESADMVLVREESKYLVDCRHWRAAEVGANAAGQLYGAMGRLEAKGGFVVTAGQFTRDAHEFARGLNVELIAGRDLARMLELAKETITGAVPLRPLAG